MWPDLGKYAFTVLGSYAAGLALMVAIVLLSLWRARAAKRALEVAEARSTRAAAARSGGRPGVRAPERAGPQGSEHGVALSTAGKGARHG